MAAIFGPYDANILVGGTVGGTAPATGYSANVLLTNRVADRVVYPTGTATITFTIPSTRGDYLTIPMHNLSGSVLTLTNGNGLSEAITIPTYQENGFPQTLAVDITALEPNPTVRTSTTWNLVIVSNASPVTLGGGVSIYGAGVTQFDRNIRWGFQEIERHHNIEHRNYYGNRLVYDLQTVTRQIKCVVVATDAQRTTLRNWFRSAHGSTNPSLFWADPSDIETAYFGTWQDELVVDRQFTNVNLVEMMFTEWPRGVAL